MSIAEALLSPRAPPPSPFFFLNVQFHAHEEKHVWGFITSVFASCVVLHNVHPCAPY